MMDVKNIFKRFKTSNVFINASFVYILANGIGQGITLLANIFFTRHMTQSDYGLYSNYYSYVSILVPFVGMNLYCGLTNAYMDYKGEIHKVRSSVLMLSIAGLFATTVIMFVLKATIGLSLTWMCVVLALAHAYGFFLVNFHIHSMNMENRIIAKGVMLAVPNILQALIAGIAVVICNTYVSRAVGGTVGVLTCGTVAALIILRNAKPAFNMEYWGYALRISLPAIIGSVSSMVMQQCDKVMITSIIGAEVAAVYALIYNIGYILYAIQQATNGVWQVWLYNTMDGKRYGNIPDVQKWYMYFMLILATGLYMLAPEIIKILSPKNYWHFEYVVPFIVGSYLMLMYTMNMSVAQYKKKTGVNSIIVSMAAAINVILNYVLIPRFGGVGAAYTSVVSYLFIFLASGIFLKLKKEYYFKDVYYLTDILLVVVFGVVFYFVMYKDGIRYLLFMLALMAECVFIVIKKDEVRRLFSGRIFEHE